MMRGRMVPMPRSCWGLAIFVLAAIILPSGALSQETDSAVEGNYTLAVCPSALWKKLLWLRGPAPQSTFDNVTHWDKEQVAHYARKTVLPQIQANVVFCFVAVAYILGFLIWRLIRRCCLACCMRESCAQKRAAADPKQIVGGCSFWVLKIALMVLATAGVAIMVAGIVTAQKELVEKLWPPLDRMNGHLTAMADDMDALMESLDGVNPIVANLSALATDDVQFAALRSSLQGISTFLDLPAADPTGIDTALASLSSGVASATSQLTSWQSQLSALQPNVSSLAANISSLSTAVSTLTTYSTRLTTLSTELTALTSAAGPSYSTTNLAAALAAVDLASWQPTVNSMLAALDAWRGLKASASSSSLSAAATALDAAMAGLKNVQLPAASSAINAFFNAWTAYSSSFGTLITRVDHIQANVVVLDVGTTAALQPLRTLHSNLTALQAQSVSPASLASDLTALASELSLGPVSALVDNLNTALGAAPSSVLDAARTAIAGVKTALDSLQPKKDATAAAMSTYNSSPTQINFDALKATASGAGNTGPLTSAAQTSAAAAASDANVIAVQTAVGTGNLVSVAGSINTDLATATTSASTAAARLSARVPPLGPYTSLTSSARAAFSGLPTPKSSALAAVQATVSDVENQLINVPANVQYQVVNVQRSFQDGVTRLRSQVIDKVNKFERDKQRPLDRADSARYQATCVIFALGAFLAALLLLFVGINCAWGVAACTLLLLVLAALLFALAVVFAAGLVAAQDGCHHSEHIALSAVGGSSSVQPLLQYYFFDSSNSSVRAVLRDAKLVDVDKVESQITGQARSVISNITAIYTPRPKLQAVIDSVQTFINCTLSGIDGVLLLAGVDQVRPLYEDLKSFPCCDAAGYGAKAWVLLTAGGWVLMTACNLAMGFLGRLDQLPHSGCCGCKPLLLSRIQKQVHPEGGDSDEEKVAKAVPLSAPAQQAMYGKGGVEPAADALPSAPPLPPPGAAFAPPPYAMGPGAAYAVFPPPPLPPQMAMSPYGGMPYGAAPPAHQHYVGAMVGAPMGPQGGMPIDPFTGMPMVAPPPPPVAPPAALAQEPAAQRPPSLFPPIGSHGAH